MKVFVQNDCGYFHRRWIKFLTDRGAEVAAGDLLAMDSLSELNGFQGCMWHLPMAPSVLQAAEPILSPLEFVLGKKIFPNYVTRWHFENKVSQKYLFEALGVRTPVNYCFWTREKALDWLDSFSGYPVVHKKSRGAGSVNVSLVRNRRDAETVIRRTFSDRGIWHQKGFFPTGEALKPVRRARNRAANSCLRIGDSITHLITGKMPHLPRKYWLPEKDCLLFQEYLPGNEFDTRVTIIGDRAFAFRRINRPGDFRASGGGMIDHDPGKIHRRCLEIAFEASSRGGFQSMAYDFLIDRSGEPVVCEMSFGYQNTAVFNCPGHWDGQLNWTEGQMWPEEAQVADFLAEF